MELDPLLLSRLQFAWVIAWHILLPGHRTEKRGFGQVREVAILSTLHPAREGSPTGGAISRGRLGSRRAHPHAELLRYRHSGLKPGIAGLRRRHPTHTNSQNHPIAPQQATTARAEGNRQARGRGGGE